MPRIPLSAGDVTQTAQITSRRQSHYWMLFSLASLQTPVLILSTAYVRTRVMLLIANDLKDSWKSPQANDACLLLLRSWASCVVSQVGSVTAQFVRLPFRMRADGDGVNAAGNPLLRRVVRMTYWSYSHKSGSTTMTSAISQKRQRNTLVWFVWSSMTYHVMLVGWMQYNVLSPFEHRIRPILGPIRKSNIFSVFAVYVTNKFNTYFGIFCS